MHTSVHFFGSYYICISQTWFKKCKLCLSLVKHWSLGGQL